MGESMLLEEVLEANRAYLAGEPVPRPRSLGDGHLLVLTCVDPRLNEHLPAAMGVAPGEMILVRNAGNRVTDRETLRSLSVMLVLGRAEEVFVVGHTDCAMRATTATSLIDGMRRVGIDRSDVPGDVREWFGGIASERTNAIESAKELRRSRMIPDRVPVHALLMDVTTGKLEVIERDDRRSGGSSRDSTTAFSELSRTTEPARPVPEPPPPRPPRPAQREAAGLGLRPPPLPERRFPEAVELTDEEETGTEEESEGSRESSPFERAEDVLARLRRKRGR